MTTLSKLSFQEKGQGLFLKKERHAQERMMKKKDWTHSKEKKESWTLEGPSIQKKIEREIEIAHVQRKRNKGERWFMKGVHTPSTQIFTHMHILIKVYNLFSPKDPVFDSATYEEQVCLQPFSLS